MTEPERPTPFDLVFGPLAGERFPPIRAAFEGKDTDPRDRDAFLLGREVLEFLRELRPDEGMGEAIGELAALVHHAWLFWADGQRIPRLDRGALALLTGDAPPWAAEGPSGAYYLQLPPRRVWGMPLEGEPPEPLDGWFASARGGTLQVLGVFGLHPARGGFTVAEVAGARPGRLARTDGTPLFAPVLEGGAAAGLHSIVAMEELLELAWRGHALLAARGPLGTGVTEIEA